MTQNFGNAFLKKPSHQHEPQKHGLVLPAPVLPPVPVVRPAVGGKLAAAAPKPTYAKVFRWRLPEGRTQSPATVEIVGTFTNWQKVPLKRDHKMDGWHVTIHDVPAHKTHHYMLLVDGQPTDDKNSDGLAVPHGPQEKQYQLMTSRGPRLFMLFAQAK